MSETDFTAMPQERSLRVLFVEDDPGDADLVRAALEEARVELKLEHVERLEDALARVSARMPDAVLLDLSLPDALGLDAVQRLRANHPELPIVVLTGAAASVGLEAVRAGAQDYLPKGTVDGHAVERAIRYSIERQHSADRARELAAEHAARESAEAAAKALAEGNEQLADANRRLLGAIGDAQAAREREATARSSAERRLHEVEALFDSMTEAVIVHDEEGRVSAVNPAASAILGPNARGMAPDDVVERIAARSEGGRPLTPGELPGIRALAGAVVKAEHVRVRTALGERALRASAAPLAHDGKIYGAVSTWRDVTERERAQEQARRYADLLQLSQDAIMVWRFDRGIEAWSDGARVLYGFTAEEARDRRPHDLLRSVFSLPVEQIEAELRDRLRWEGAITHTSKDGRTIFVSARLQVVRGDDGIDRVLETNRDVTERLRAEDALRAANAQLVEADRRKNEFLAMLSHELRNPLAPIRNSLYILERASPGSEQARRAMTVIDRQIAHTTRLVDDLLDVTRISRGKIHLRREVLDLGELVRATVEDHRSSFARNGIELAIATARGVFVTGDATRLAQVLGNLVHNAAKFTGRGGRTTVSVDADTASRTAVVRVRDTGVGITPEMLPHLFEPFIQAETTLDRAHGGLGLGLALARGLVHMHGGEIVVRSDGLGKGSEFLVTLPLAASAAAVLERARVRAPAAALTRVLVIEDNGDAADTLKRALELNAHVVEVAANGLEGLEKARRFRPDVVLCDIGLPGIDGYEVAKRIRADPELRGTHLVALSGYALPEDVERALASGFELHLAKPPSVDDLERQMSEVVAR